MIRQPTGKTSSKQRLPADNAMFWEEDDNKGPYKVPDDVVDIGFKLKSKTLPLEHAWALSEALHDVLPWIREEDTAGIHQIHGAESGNGWLRPEDTENELLHLSRRSKMFIRTPKAYQAEVEALTGQVFDIAGHKLEIGDSFVKMFGTQPEQFCRYVIVESDEEDESAFLQRVVQDLGELLDTRIRKIMCGKPHTIRVPEGDIQTRSVMVADLDPQLAVKLQQHGVGRGRHLGCGLFVPHKGIKAVGETEDKSHFTGAE